MIKNLTLLISFCFLLLSFSSRGACGNGFVQVDLSVLADNFPTETWWEILDANGNQLAVDSFGTVGGVTQTYQYCLPESLSCLTFYIHDVYGDGICCTYGSGSYTLSVNGTTIASGGSYGFGETTDFNCPVGASCGSAEAIQDGIHSTTTDNYWYSFTPSVSGVYDITTCGQSNTCNSTTLWIYDHCNDIVITEGVQGAIFFSNSGCSTGALINATFIAGQTYIIRVGDGAGNPCGTDPITWNISYVGPITGCTSPTACNFDPNATADDGSCIFPPNPLCGGPDLAVDSADLVSTLSLTSYQADNCSVTENCVTGYGNRQVITFEMHIRNIGNQDFFIGAPPADINTPSPVFEWATCHGHWHFQHYGKYTLYDINGNQIPVGLKNGFCVLDLECDGGGAAKYGCGNMGITAGCGDIYGAGTTCQWIDVTDVDTGIYVFQADVNWLHATDALGRNELTFDNNIVRACFHLSRDQNNNPSIQLLQNCSPWTDCTGQLMGNAQTDCDGNCNGYALQGDINSDTLRHLADDVVAYVANVQTNAILPVVCTDLDGNDSINVVDAALLQQCVIHGSDESYWGAQIPCLFPTGRHNPNQIGVLTIGASAQNYVDVFLNCPLSKIMGFQFKMSGIVAIDSVVSLVPGFNPVLRWSNLEISGLDTTEATTPKFFVPTAFLRVYFSGNLPATICIAEIADLVNENYETVDHQIANACADVAVGLRETNFSKFLAAIPNPFTHSTTVYFPNENRIAFSGKLIDMMGREVRSFTGLYGQELSISSEGLLPGVYTVVMENGVTKYLTRIVAL